ncbi:hypothetical protein Vretifemale_20962 [Volvox reticuliferus]|uniref:Pherophorin domain-containing protein n=1 Tax=Volvox reticuliferus TaxID=1737510 RepID=A0A8J4D7G2_9CHLO|nr:hypothetical protein Vretifemale_20962 [Volvox reticuliferus]
MQFNVSSSCLVQPAPEIKATINNVNTRISPSLDWPLNGRNGSAILRLTQLGLTTVSAANAEVCITLKTNRGSQGCTTLEQLCVSHPDEPLGTCTVAMFDITRTCCPISQTYPTLVPNVNNQTVPIPPSPPPPSPIPPSPRECLPRHHPHRQCRPRHHPHHHLRRRRHPHRHPRRRRRALHRRGLPNRPHRGLFHTCRHRRHHLPYHLRRRRPCHHRLSRHSTDFRTYYVRMRH